MGVNCQPCNGIFVLYIKQNVRYVCLWHFRVGTYITTGYLATVPGMYVLVSIP